MVQSRQNIPITEDWMRTEWSNFDTDLAQTSLTGLGRQASLSFPFGLGTQQHIDIRSFLEPQGWNQGGIYPSLSLYPSSSLYPGTAPGNIMVTGYLPAFNHWPGAICSLTPGLNNLVSNDTTPLDLTVLQDLNATLVVALPQFPYNQIDLTNSYIDLSSDGFNNQICSLRWSNSLTPLVTGNSTLTFAYQALTGIALTAVTGVRFRITATNSCTMYLMGLRLIGSQWVQTNVDFDNLDGQLRQTIPLNGDVSLTTVAPNKVVPPLWRSAVIPGVDDPRPIDTEMSFLFNTGSQTKLNSASLYMREETTTPVTQSDLQGVMQSALQGQTQATLEDESPTSQWIKFTVSWGPITSMQITDAVHPTSGYTYPSAFTLTPNTSYLAVCNLTDTTARMQIYNVNQTTLVLGTLLFDSTIIPDTYMFARRSGRLGFQAILQDGDAYIGAIRPRSLMFAEYRSAPLTSITPVRGAQLYVQASDSVELFNAWSPLADAGGRAPLVTIDQQRYSQANHASARVTVTAPSTGAPAQGILSNSLSPANDSISGITDFSQLHIELSLWVPGTALTSPYISGDSLITAAITNSLGAVIPINLPPLVSDQWQSISIFRPFMQPNPQSGPYQLVLYYMGTVPATFWVDRVSFHQHSVSFYARSMTSDPWRSNFAPWTPFHNTINDNASGIHFTNPGKTLQVRAQALTQNAMVMSSPKLVPRYAELGRFVWPEDAPLGLAGPTAQFTASNVGRTFTLNGTGSSSPNLLGNYYWDFGDGYTGAGPIVQHTYGSWLPVGSAYTVTLTVTDRAGQTAISTPQIITL